MSDPSGESITLHSTWRGLVANVAGASIVTLIGVIAVVANGFRVVPTIVLGVGLVFMATALFDYPVATTFTAGGLERRMIARRQEVPWERVRQLSRARPGITNGLRGLRHGGLVAVIGRRRYLLVDQCEARTEYEALMELLADRSDSLGLAALGVPEDQVPPTWVSRRSKWNPNVARDR